MTKRMKPSSNKRANIKPKNFSIVNESSQQTFPVIGIGASAGGLIAFEEFFSNLPADKDLGVAFVLVQHLAPDHKSMLSDLVGQYTKMQVHEAEDGLIVMPNNAYIIPSNCDMAFSNGALHLFKPASPRGQRLPIDFFYRSLAAGQKDQAIGIVLSGMRKALNFFVSFKFVPC